LAVESSTPVVKTKTDADENNFSKTWPPFHARTADDKPRIDRKSAYIAKKDREIHSGIEYFGSGGLCRALFNLRPGLAGS
jgi:hypothetical protein